MTLCNHDTTKSQMTSKEGRRRGCYEHTLDSVVMMISISRMMKQKLREDAHLMMWLGFMSQNVDGKTKKRRKVESVEGGGCLYTHEQRPGSQSDFFNLGLGSEMNLCNFQVSRVTIDDILTTLDCSSSQPKILTR